MRNDSQKVRCIGVLWIFREDLPIELLCHVQLASAVLLHREFERLLVRDKSHRAAGQYPVRAACLQQTVSPLKGALVLIDVAFGTYPALRKRGERAFCSCFCTTSS